MNTISIKTQYGRMDVPIALIDSVGLDGNDTVIYLRTLRTPDALSEMLRRVTNAEAS